MAKDNDKLKDYTPEDGITAELESSEICCPHCGHDNVDIWECPEMWTVNGTDGNRREFDCDSCETTFYVEEQVSRTFVSFKDTKSPR